VFPQQLLHHGLRQPRLDPRRQRVLVIFIYLPDQLPLVDSHHGLELHAVDLATLEFQSKLPWGFQHRDRIWGGFPKTKGQDRL